MKLVQWALFVMMILCYNVVASQPKYEFRAVWIATIGNIDWPTSKSLSADAQKQEFISILDRQKAIGMNAVIVQIRPAADAFYNSPYEPWSEYMNGTQGMPPYPYYDPLQFMIDETHKRGMEFHAWINPYRAVSGSSIMANHISKTHPEWMISYGDKKYFNPGLPEVMQYLKNIVVDILTRYDIDGLHMDDYFYPYPIPGRQFNDAAAYNLYNQGLTKPDWRRANCDSIVKMIHDAVVEFKPLIKFGISPFGVWRNSNEDTRGSDTRGGLSCYNNLYADVLLWLQKGWIDYVAPQLYWEIGHRTNDYETLLEWWANNSFGKDVYIGMAAYRAFEQSTPAYRTSYEIPDEIKMLRNYKTVKGSIFYRSRDILRNPFGWADSLKNNYYRAPAIIPPMTWIDEISPLPPTIDKVFKNADTPDGPTFVVQGKAGTKDDNEVVRNIAIYIGLDTANITAHPFAIIPASNGEDYTWLFQTSLLPANWINCYITTTNIDKENNESKPAKPVELKKDGREGWKVK